MVQAEKPGWDDGASRLALGELLEMTPAGVAYLAGPDLVFEFANEEYRRYVGERELIGQPLHLALPELPPDRVELVASVYRSGQPFYDDQPVVWVDARAQKPQQMYLNRVCKPVPGRAGGVAGVLIYVKDVTAEILHRRRLDMVAKRLAITEERYRTLFETLPYGVIHFSSSGTVLGANPAAGEIFGLTPEEITTWPINSGRKPFHEDGSEFRDDELPVAIAMRTGKIIANVLLGISHGRTGETRWLRVTAVPDARDEYGQAQRAYAMFTDITEQRRTEARVKKSNALLGSLMDANVLGVIVSREDGRVLDANDAYLDLVGYTRDDVQAGQIAWKALTPPEWAARDRQSVEELRRTGASQPYEKEFLHKDGHRIPVLIGSVVIDDHPLRGATYVVDLSARQRREQEQTVLRTREQAARNVADTAREKLAFLHQTGEAVAANPDDLMKRVSELVDAAVVDSAVVSSRDGILTDSDTPRTARAHEALQSINAELEERVARRTSELIQAETDRRALQTELQRAERMQTVGQLASGIAHDFGNLLSVIVGYAEMAEDLGCGQNPEVHRLFEEIRGAADRAVHLSGDLLRFGSRARTESEEIDVNELVAGLRDLLNVSMSGSAEVVFRPSPTPLPPVRADRGQIEQVLLNLAVNARDAMPDGGTLTISTRVAREDEKVPCWAPGTLPGRYVELRVADTGTGMSEEVKSRVFERFFTTKREHAGTGLGLSTARGIIADAGGTIDVHSEEGRGSTFCVYLPALSPA